MLESACDSPPARVVRVLLALQLAITMFVASLYVNVLQALSWALFFIPKTQRAALVSRLSASWLDIPSFSVVKLGGVKFRIVGDESFTADDVDCGIMIANHSPGLDFIGGMVASKSLGVSPGSVYALMKRSLKLVPGLGWIMYLNGSLFLSRDYKRDKQLIEKQVNEICEVYPKPFWIGIYPEGTRITDEKRIESHKFAKERDLPQLNHVLLPRSKGLNVLLSVFRGRVQTLFNLTFAYENGPLSMSDFFLYGRYRTKAVHVYCERTLIKAVPEDEDGLRDWLIKSFAEKDQRLDYFYEHDKFEGKPLQGLHNTDPTPSYAFWSTAVGLSAVSFGVFAPWQLGAWLALVLFAVSNASTREETEEEHKNGRGSAVSSAESMPSSGDEDSTIHHPTPLSEAAQYTAEIQTS